MTKQRFDEAWGVPLRKRERQILLGMGFHLLVTAGLFAVVLSMLAPSIGGIGKLGGVWIFAAIATVIATLVMSHQIRMLRRQRLGVITNNGDLCPHCFAVLDVADERLCCANCNLQLEPEAVYKYWDSIVQKGAKPERPGKSRRLFHWFDWRTRRLWKHHVLIFLPMGLVYIIFDIIGDKSALEVWMRVPASLLIVLAMATGMWSMVRNKDDREFCAGCSYPKPEGTQSPVCSECGSDWSAAVGVRLGTTKPYMPGLILAIVFGVLWIGLTFSSMWMQSEVVKVLPNSMLIGQLQGSYFMSSAAMDELKRRTLSAEEEATVAAMLLADPDGNSLSDVRSWMSGFVINQPESALTTSFMERDLAFIDGEVSFYMTGDERRGAIDITVQHDRAIRGMSSEETAFVLNELFLDDVAVPLDDELRHTLFTDFDLEDIGDWDAAQSLWMLEDLLIPGELELSSTYQLRVSITQMIVTNSRPWNTTLKRDEDGSVISPAGTLAVRERIFEIEIASTTD